MRQLVFNYTFDKIVEEIDIFKEVPKFLKKYFNRHNKYNVRTMFYFDIDENVLLYEIKNDEKSYKVKEVYLIEKNGLYECINKQYCTYEELIKNDYNTEAILYLDNLDKLKENELYKYSYIWELKDAFKNYNDIDIKSLIIFPIYYKEFEYLIKQKFYNLAINYTDKIKYEGNFYNTFKLPKERLNYFNKEELTLVELEVLRIFNIKNRELLDFISFFFESKAFIEYLKEKNYSSKDLKTYMHFFESAESCYLYYKDFIKDVENKNSILYPDNINNLELSLEKIIEISSPKINESIKEIGNLLKVNDYENDEYIIRPILSLNDLLSEAKMQRNCVAKYYNEIVKGKHQIYVMRNKKNIDKSLVTIEVTNNKVTMAKEKFNKDVSKNLMDIINEWEKSLITVEIY